MGSFADTLRDFRSGLLSEDAVLEHANAELRESVGNRERLLSALSEEQASHPERAIHLQSIEQHILSHTRSSDRKQLSDTVVIDDSSEDADTSTATRDPDPPRPAVGSTLNKRFRLTKLIGRGGMSSVFKAIDLRKIEARSDDPFVAIKVLNPPFNDETRALSLLQNEAAKLQTLAHPNIVRVFDCDRDGRSVFMTMEYLKGESLEQRLQRAAGEPLPSEEASRIIESIANALAMAHRTGIVHGDLKPVNVFLTDRGEVKVIDFGIARLLRRATENSAAQTEMNALTPDYASPEMLEKTEPDPRDDIYALACIAHEILTGEHPFGRTDALHARNAGRELVRRQNLSSRQYRAIAHGLAFDRAARTPAATQFLEELSRSSPPRSFRPLVYAGLGLAAVAIGLLGWLHRAPAPSEALNAPPPAISSPPSEVFRDCPTCPLVKLIPAGRFYQGSPEKDPAAQPTELPQHSVTIPAPFVIGAYEITVAEYKEFVDSTHRTSGGCEVYNGSWQMRRERSWDTPGFEQSPEHPAVCVSWNDAKDYVAWLSLRTHFRYRLPSSSEWEYAARAGATGAAPWDDAASACRQANLADQTAVEQFPGWGAGSCADGYVFTAAVGSFAPNAFGLFDMFGNSFEWVEDCWHDDYRGAPADGAAWVSDRCSEHEIRGGSWFSGPELARSAYRNRFDADYRANSVGFRVLREIKP